MQSTYLLHYSSKSVYNKTFLDIYEIIMCRYAFESTSLLFYVFHFVHVSLSTSILPSDQRVRLKFVTKVRAIYQMIRLPNMNRSFFSLNVRDANAMSEVNMVCCASKMFAMRSKRGKNARRNSSRV